MQDNEITIHQDDKGTTATTSKSLVSVSLSAAAGETFTVSITSALSVDVRTEEPRGLERQIVTVLAQMCDRYRPGSSVRVQMVNHDILDWRVDTVDPFRFSLRLANCLSEAGIKYAGQLVQTPHRRLGTIQNFGHGCMTEVVQKLAEHGLYIGMSVGGWRKPREE